MYLNSAALSTAQLVQGLCVQAPPGIAGDGVEISFEDGSTVRSKLVLGADGYHSRVREHCLGDGPPDFAVRPCVCISKGRVQQLQRVVLGREPQIQEPSQICSRSMEGRCAFASMLAAVVCI